MDDILPLVGLIVVVFFVIVGLRAAMRAVLRPKTRPKPGQRPRQQPRTPPEIETNPRSILVDGSNVMHWVDNTPRVETLQRVLAKLRNTGNDPILCFDANIGYKLVNQHMNTPDLAKFFGVAQRNILICPSGTDADAMILKIAVDKGLPVVSNDGYRDYPDLITQVSRMTGKFKAHEVSLRLHTKP